MNRTGNLHSDLLKAATTVMQENNASPEVGFTKTPQKSLADIVKEAQMGMEPGGDMVDPTMGELPGGPEEEAPGQEAKQHVCDALIALCGGIEEAHACLDECGGGMEGAGQEEMPPPMMDEGGPEPMLM